MLTLVDFAAAQKYGIRVTSGDPDERATNGLAELTPLVAAGDLVLKIGDTCPMSDAGRAHVDLEAGSVSGELVLVNEE